MGTYKAFVFRVILFALSMWTVFEIATPASASESDTVFSSYGINITLKYNDGNKSYQANAFLLEDDGGCFVLAEYSSEHECYMATGFTEDAAAATLLRCGNCLEQLECLAISGLPQGTYFLTHVETEEGYQTIGDPVEICFTASGATVDGKPVNVILSSDNVCAAALTIQVANAYQLPVLYSSYWQMILGSKWIQLAILLILLFVTCLVTLLASSICKNKHLPK